MSKHQKGIRPICTCTYSARIFPSIAWYCWVVHSSAIVPQKAKHGYGLPGILAPIALHYLAIHFSSYVPQKEHTQPDLPWIFQIWAKIILPNSIKQLGQRLWCWCFALLQVDELILKQHPNDFEWRRTSNASQTMLFNQIFKQYDTEKCGNCLTEEQLQKKMNPW